LTLIIRPYLTGDLPGEQFPGTTGWTGIADGVVVGAGGLVPVVGEHIAFITLLDERYRIPSVFYRLARRVLVDAQARGLPRVVTMADMRIPRTRAWLLRLGFHPVGPEFECVPILRAAALHSYEVYTWQKWPQSQPS
jgi:hypothetical protein